MATAAASKPISNIAAAIAAQSASVDIPKPRDGGYTPYGSDNVADTTANSRMLPTPPNSISPSLPPHKVRPFYPSAEPPSTHLDSDIDLQDAPEQDKGNEKPQALSSAALSGLEATGAITPTMLAKHHLPDILLANGPMAIRHVLGHLTQTVPGFSRIPPAKARRIVVGALESRGGGGVSGDVIFEKVGWGRWDARVRGQQSGTHAVSVPEGGAQLGVSPPASVPGSYTLSSAGGLRIPDASRRYRRNLQSGGSWAAESTLSSREEDLIMGDMEMHDADKMSVDDRRVVESYSASSEELLDMDDDLDDATDEEDWAGMGPEAFRRNATGTHLPHRNYNHLALSSARAKNAHHHNKKHHSSRLYKAPGAAASTAPHQSSSLLNTSSSVQDRNHRNHQGNGVFGQPATAAACDSQEREAIEALLRMGSM